METRVSAGPPDSVLSRASPGEQLQVERDRTRDTARGDEGDGQRRAGVEGSPAERGGARRLTLLSGPDHPLGPGLDQQVAETSGGGLKRREEDDAIQRRWPAQDELADACRREARDLDDETTRARRRDRGLDGHPHAPRVARLRQRQRERRLRRGGWARRWARSDADGRDRRQGVRRGGPRWSLGRHGCETRGEATINPRAIAEVPSARPSWRC